MSKQKQHILLTGGTGLIGTRLTNMLLDKGYAVSHLSRAPGKDKRVKTYLWDVNKSEIDPRCLDGIDTVVHLAGAGIADKRWTKARKKELLDSRTESIRLIYRLMKNDSGTVESVISASAIGYYSDRGDELMTETSPPAKDFLAECCVKWEQAVDEGDQLGLRIVKLRTGVVLDKEGGALKQLAMPVKLYVGSPIGTGNQWTPWIHWEDVLDMYLYAIEHPGFKGVFNMVAPNPVINKDLTKAVASQLHKPLWAPNVPAFALKLLMGEMSTVVLGSTRVSAQKVADAGFKFKFRDIQLALKEIYG